MASSELSNALVGWSLIRKPARLEQLSTSSAACKGFNRIVFEQGDKILCLWRNKGILEGLIGLHRVPVTGSRVNDSKRQRSETASFSVRKCAKKDAITSLPSRNLAPVGVRAAAGPFHGVLLPCEESCGGGRDTGCSTGAQAHFVIHVKGAPGLEPVGRGALTA